MASTGVQTLAAFLLVVLAVLQLPTVGARRWRSSSSYSDIPSSCYRPSGSDCTWYRNCLERKIPCSRRSGDYAIAYAEKYCNRYQSNYNSFSSAGKRWVNAVKRCLQVKLAPVLSQSLTCPSIKRKGFESHVPCYLNPGYGAPGFCQLSSRDMRRVFSTIKGALLTDLWATVSGGWQTIRNCLGNH
ncbi:uncharacterized protein [Littorina saxatilis]|uniref:Uncharacterized protein n=1 Tax=Littorina saxatilis TaxID=31220 RepID=A0AAN9GFW7_9CAEN